MIQPDTPASRALLRAIANQDVAGAAAALAAGADPNVAWGAPGSSQPTCSALMKAVEVGGTGNPDIVGLLLAAGVPVFHLPHGHGRLPLREALRYARTPVVERFIAHAGGLDAFIESAAAPAARREILEALAGHAITVSAFLADVFFRVWDATDPKLRPRSEFECGVPWPWGKMAWVKDLPGDVMERLSARVPLPTPQSSGFVVWSHWVDFTLRAGRDRALLPMMLATTPPQWWVRPLEHGPDHPARTAPQPSCLLARAALVGQAQPLARILKIVARLPGGLEKHVRPLSQEMVLGAAKKGSPPTLRVITRALPAPWWEPHLDRALDQAARDDFDPHHRARAIQCLVELGGDTLRSNERGDTVHHQLAKWRSGGGHRDDLLRQLPPCGLDAPNHAGLSPLALLEMNDPPAAAQLRQWRMDQALAAPATTARKRGVRL